MSFLISTSVFAFLVILFSKIPVQSAHEDSPYLFREQVGEPENCPVNSGCIAIERCPHFYRTLNENRDGSPVYISCTIDKNVMAVHTLGICCNDGILDESVVYTDDNQNIDSDLLDDLMVDESLSTEDFTRRVRGATAKIQPPPQAASHTSTQNTGHQAPKRGDSYDLHRNSEGTDGGDSEVYYSGLRPEELVYVLESPQKFNPSKSDDHTEAETTNAESEPNYYPYFLPHLASAGEIGEKLTSEGSELRNETPDNYDPNYYEDNFCPWKCRGRPGAPGPIGPRGFPGPPGPPGRVIYVHVPAASDTTKEDSTSQQSSSLSEISSFGDEYKTDNEGTAQLQQYETSEDPPRFNGDYDSYQYNNRRYNGYKPSPYNRALETRPRITKRYRRSAKVSQEDLPSNINVTELRQLISQLIKDYFNNRK